MTKEQFILEMNRQVKLVRTEYGLTQEAMAMALGLSKKTLVEIEKGRSSLGWARWPSAPFFPQARCSPASLAVKRRTWSWPLPLRI